MGEIEKSKHVYTLCVKEEEESRYIGQSSRSFHQSRKREKKTKYIGQLNRNPESVRVFLFLKPVWNEEALVSVRLCRRWRERKREREVTQNVACL